MFEHAHAYRRAVDERLFQLGQRRYDALLDTLIQLRQPQLSRRPDEKLLSAALTEALPPLPPELLADVADALSQLEALRAELERAQRLMQAVQAFDVRYRLYAGMASRRQARGLRQAQTEFDNASRGHADALAHQHTARAAEQLTTQRHGNAQTLLVGSRHRHETLLADPRNSDALRLHDAATQARRTDADRAQAEHVATAAHPLPTACCRHWPRGHRGRKVNTLHAPHCKAPRAGPPSSWHRRRRRRRWTRSTACCKPKQRSWMPKPSA